MGLEEIRKEIDLLDDELVDVLGKRMELVKQVAAVKAKGGIPIRQIKREEELLARQRQAARKHELGEEFIEKIFRVVLDESCRIQNGS